MAKPRYTVPRYIEGEETGGVIVGKWLEKANDLQVNKGKGYEIPLNPLTGKMLGILYHGGFVGFKNCAKNKSEVYKLPNMFAITLRMVPLLLTVFAGYEIIGLWHTHPPGSPDMSDEDWKSINKYMRHWGV